MLRLLIRDVVHDLGLRGVCRRLVVLDAHFDNAWPVVADLDLGSQELRPDGVRDMQALRRE